MAGRLRRVLRWLGLGVGSAAGLGALIVGAGLLIPGCSVGYVTRQSAAHLKVLAARQPVEGAIRKGEIPDEWLPKIETLRDAKRFGADSLGLPTEGLYETISLADVGPTWIVTACPKDSLRPVTWWFPFVGRVAYKGYYNKDGAERLAGELRDAGNDVMMYPAAAFSTLGYFADPIRPSMLEGDDGRIANLVLHESAHRVLYWKGQTTFNESFASFVGDVGAERYLESRFGEGCELCRKARAAWLDGPLFGELIGRTIGRLEALYAEPAPREEKLERREEIFARAKEEYAAIAWNGAGYPSFLRRELDNAIILSYRRYGSGQDVFAVLLERCGGDVAAAIDLVYDLGWKKLPRKRRREVTPLDYLQELLAGGVKCPAGS